MPRKFPKPFFRTSRNCWYVQIGKEQIKLHPDEDEALRIYHEVMTAKAKEPKPAVVNDEITVAEVFDKFLTWCESHRATRTFEGYRDWIQAFCSARPETETMPVSSLKPFHVAEWIDKYPEWGPAYRRQAIQAIQRPFAWADRLGYIDRSPIRGLEKPKPVRREQSVSDNEWQKIRDHYRDGDPFRDIIEFMWETGCRPQEAKRLEIRHLDLANHRVVFPKSEAKGKQRIRVIVLTPRAEEILTRRRVSEVHGLIFTNRTGQPWTASAMSCRFARLKKTLKVKFAPYSLRHGFADRMLMGNRDCMTVAALMGHADTQMLSQHYAALDRQTEYLRKQLTGT